MHSKRDGIGARAGWACDGLLAAGLIALMTGALGCDPGTGGRGGGPGGGIDVDDPGAADDGSADDGDAGEDPGAPDPSGDDDDDDSDPGQPADNPPTPELPFDPGKLQEVCARGNGDRVAQALCNGVQLTSLTELREALEFVNPFFALTGNSTSLVGRKISAINPRLVVGDKTTFFGFPFPDDVFPDGEGDELEGSGLLAMGYARGDQFVELMAYDPNKDDLNLYLLVYEQACNASPDGCSTSELVTPAVESNWTRWTLYQDEDLVNTTLDCNVCHQPLGPGTPKVPRMQEVANSWTHWFPTRPPPPPPPGGGGGWGSPSGGSGETDGVPPFSDGHGTASSAELWDLFTRMHSADENYGGVPIAEISDSEAGPDMESFVANYLMSRQNLPESLAFPMEGVEASSDYFCNSSDMELDGASSSWSVQYARALEGNREPPPSPRIDISFEPTREAAIQSYIDVMSGAKDPSEIVDPTAVMSTSVLTELSIAPRSDASAQEILTHMCARCHNDSLDQTITRSNFNAMALTTLSEEDKDLIADRLDRDHTDAKLMPPSRFATMPDWAKDRVLQWLDEQ